ncbi:MAG: hypothetical protein PHV34_17595 [Verrucomicrobiae bacterium]|nr:hypothetical protein [Verrucomicrobiae bacterium]
MNEQAKTYYCRRRCFFRSHFFHVGDELKVLPHEESNVPEWFTCEKPVVFQPVANDEVKSMAEMASKTPKTFVDVMKSNIPLAAKEDRGLDLVGRNVKKAAQNQEANDGERKRGR